MGVCAFGGVLNLVPSLLRVAEYTGSDKGVQPTISDSYYKKHAFTPCVVTLCTGFC